MADTNATEVDNAQKNSADFEALANEMKDLKASLAKVQAERDEANTLVLQMANKKSDDSTCEFDKIFIHRRAQ